MWSSTYGRTRADDGNPQLEFLRPVLRQSFGANAVSDPPTPGALNTEGKRGQPMGPDRRGQITTLDERATEAKTPRRYAVVLHNDDFTTMEFVVWVLVQLFECSLEEATQLMLQVHETGAAKVGTYPRAVAETKRSEVTMLAEEQGMPLLVTIEPS